MHGSVCTNKSYYYIVIDSEIVEVATSPIICADILFKLHFAFNVHNDPNLTYFFQFLECAVYRIPGHKPNAVVDTLNTKVQNIS